MHCGLLLSHRRTRSVPRVCVNPGPAKRQRQIRLSMKMDTLFVLFSGASSWEKQCICGVNFLDGGQV